MTAPHPLAAMPLCLALTLALALPACGGGQKQPSDNGDKSFDCDARRIAYIATNHFAGPEVGVVVDCAERGPRIKRWVVIDEDGGKSTNEHSLTTAEFEDLWEKVDSTGWRNLTDCDNPEMVEGDPLYRFGIKQQDDATSLTCGGKTLPFPYDRLTNELDLLVAQYSL